MLEQSRKAWLEDSLVGSPLWKLNYAVSDIGYLLATLDEPEAIKQGKRWVKLQQKLSEGIAWLRTIDLLRDSLNESDLNKIASAVPAIFKAPEQMSQNHGEARMGSYQTLVVRLLESLPPRIQRKS